MKKTALAASLLLTVTANAQAEFPVGKVGFNLAPRADIEADDFDEDGDGLGFYAEIGSDMIFGYADLQKTSIESDPSDLDVDELRFGLGLRTDAGAGSLMARVERYDLTLDPGGEEFEDDGFGVHVGGELPLGDSAITLFGSVGMLSLDDIDGNEYRVGLSGEVSDSAELYGAYRMAALEDDADEDIDLSDFRIGINILF